MFRFWTSTKQLLVAVARQNAASNGIPANREGPEPQVTKDPSQDSGPHPGVLYSGSRHSDFGV